MAGAPPASPAQPTDHPRRSLVRGSSRKRAVSVACPRSLWQLITSAEAVRLQHEQTQRLCRAISGRPTSTASSTTTSGTRMFATPPLLTDDPAEQLHEIAGNPPTSGSSCSATAAAASLATAVARQTLSAGTLDTAVAPSTTPTSSSDVLLEGDFVAVTGLPGASLVEPQYVPLPIDANLEDMDTTITRKRSRPSELGSDDEGASRKVQAVGTAPHNASTTKLPPHVTGEDDRHLTLASGITTEGEFQQVLSKAQKRRQRSALPPGLAGNIPSPGTEPAVAPAARPTAPCSSPAPIAPPDVDPVATAGVPRTSVPTSPLTSRTVLGKTARSRECLTVDWRAFRKHCQKDADSGTFLQLVADSAKAATIRSTAQYFPEQQSGFRCQRCTADSISDVVATLEDAKATGDVAMLVLLDVKSAFDGLPHAVIEACLDRLGLSGCLRRFISAFLTGRTFRVRVGQELSEPRDITTGVPQGSVLSPFLFNMALAGLPASLPADPRFPVRCSIYADDVALWTRGPRKFMPSIRCSLQRALDAVTAFLGSIGLTVSTAKTEAMLIHPLASARRYTKQLKIAGRALPWQQMESDVPYHKFPRRSSPRRQRWIDFVRASGRGDTWTPRESSRICSRHFAPSCYKEHPARLAQLGISTKGLFLEPGALPTVYPGPPSSAGASVSAAPLAKRPRHEAFLSFRATSNWCSPEIDMVVKKPRCPDYSSPSESEAPNVKEEAAAHSQNKLPISNQ
ncbi:hypothetical protein HPB49_001429 [Dermacentor silvarum]|uniref:Uncharacterized protein n=1 Tax=Dermacentor silvarum TaxID=543639 RepID=A0ACB8CP03_DERSI|nr:hypothetical protein HPB49_001429 [Dermacentor silvarum]